MKRRIIVILTLCILSTSLFSCKKTVQKTTSPTGTTPTVSTSPTAKPSQGESRTKYDNDSQRFINFWLAGFNGNNLFDTQYQLERNLPKFGANCVDVWACWYNIEKVQGQYDFSKYDQIIDLIASYGAKVYLRINTMDIPRWILRNKDEKGRCIYTQWDSNGNDIINGSSTGGERAGFISFANPEARQFILDFTKELVKHYTEKYKDYPGGSPIRLYAGAYSHCGEMEYYFNPESSDYSPAAINAFRNWLQKRYGDISLLNERWGTKYKNFDEATAPIINENTETVQEMDWLEYKAYEQGRMIKDQADIIHEADPNAKFTMVYGSVFDALIKRRGSLFADYWTDYVDWIGVADTLNYNHRYSMSLVRGISKGDGFYNEAFKEMQNNADLRQKWSAITEESFDEGANQMNYAGFPFNDVSDETYDYYRVAEDYIKDAQKVVRPATKRAIYMSTWSITRDTYNITMNEGNQIFNNLRKAGHIDIIRDGTFENDVDYLVNTYTDIYFANNQYISDSARAALIEAQKRGVKLHDANCVMDKYGNTRLGFDKINTDKTAPRVKVIASKGSIVGIASDIGSGISKIEITFSDGKVIAKGTDTWSASTESKSGKATVIAYDNNGNASASVTVTIK